MEVWGGSRVVDSGVVMAGLDAWVYCKPYAGDDAGGDVYYVSSCATGRITRLLLADVSGHGSAVCDVAGQLRSLMRKFVNQIEQTQFVWSLNEKFVTMSKAGCFATAIVTTFFAPTRELSLSNAGHPPPLLYRAKTKRWSAVDEHSADATTDNGNFPLGIVELVAYDQFNIRLNVGDLVVCYTDSLIEAKDQNGEMLGTEGLCCGSARTIDVRDAAKVSPLLLEAIGKLSPGNLRREDDVTVLVFRPNGIAPQPPAQGSGFASRSVRVLRDVFSALRQTCGRRSQVAGVFDPQYWRDDVADA